MEPPTVREVIDRLKREGFQELRCVGDHRHFRKDGRTVTVSGKLSSHVRKGTWSEIKRQAGWQK